MVISCRFSSIFGRGVLFFNRPVRCIAAPSYICRRAWPNPFLLGLLSLQISSLVNYSAAASVRSRSRSEAMLMPHRMADSVCLCLSHPKKVFSLGLWETSDFEKSTRFPNWIHQFLLNIHPSLPESGWNEFHLHAKSCPFHAIISAKVISRSLEPPRLPSFLRPLSSSLYSAVSVAPSFGPSLVLLPFSPLTEFKP